MLTAAITEFAAKGLHGASTEAIAAAAGISHPYLFKLFGTKKDLFLAASERVYARIRNAFAAAALGEPDPEAALWAMGKAYYDLLEQREELRLLLHGVAAAGDRDIGDTIRRHYADLFRFVRDRTGVAPALLQAFWAHGMMMTVIAAADFPALVREEESMAPLLDLPT